MILDSGTIWKIQRERILCRGYRRDYASWRKLEWSESKPYDSYDWTTLPILANSCQLWWEIVHMVRMVKISFSSANVAAMRFWYDFQLLIKTLKKHESLLDMQEVTGSIPVSPTIDDKGLGKNSGPFLFLYNCFAPDFKNFTELLGFGWKSPEVCQEKSERSGTVSHQSGSPSFKRTVEFCKSSLFP